jgi:hypothetical protein
VNILEKKTFCPAILDNDTERNIQNQSAAARKGAGCISCHSAGLDYTRMNNAHP